MDQNNNICVLIIHHRHGDNVTAHRSSQGMESELYEFVKTWWGKEVPGKEIPEDKDEAIGAYFEEMTGTESYEEYDVPLQEDVPVLAAASR